jgi:hypothetical protein
MEAGDNSQNMAQPSPKSNQAKKEDEDRRDSERQHSDDQIDNESDDAPRQHAFEQFRVGLRIVGVRRQLGIDTAAVLSMGRPWHSAGIGHARAEKTSCVV